MISKFKSIFKNYKYLFKADFFISRKNFLVVFLLTLMSLLSSFIIIYSSIPFLDFMLVKNFENHQGITRQLSSFFKTLNLEPSFFLFGSLFFLSVLFKSIADVVYAIYISRIKYFYMQNECLALNKKVFNMRQEFQLKYSTSKLLNLYTIELERSAEVLNHLLLSINFILQIVIILATTLYLNFGLTTFFFLVLIVLISPMMIINYFSVKLGIRSTIVANNHYKALINNISYLKFISIHGVSPIADSLFLKNFIPYKKNKLATMLIGFVTRAYLQPIGILAVMISIYFFSNEKESLTVLGTIIWGLTRTLGPINSVMGSLNVVSMEIPAFKNLYETKNNFNNLEVEQGNKIIDNIDKITLKKISFNYEEKNILNDTDFEIAKGEKVALLGDTGSGKSTLLDILTNITQIKSGKRLINETTYENINFKEFRNKISYVSQTIPMLDATIKEYFQFYMKDIKDEEILRYLKFMNCDQFLEIDISILEMYMGDKGMKLSGGQKQKIILAAALSRKPQILILDESTNALDSDEEQRVMQKISESKSIMLIHVSHRLRNKEMFDKIYNIKNNTVDIQK